MEGKAPLCVAEIEALPVLVPRSGTFRLQRGPSAQVSPFTVLRLTADNGVTGYGECVTRWGSLHLALREHVLDSVKGHDVFDIAGFHQRLDQVETLVTERREHWNPLRAAIEMAMYDVQGRHLGLPLHALLGGKQRSHIETVTNIGIGDPDAGAVTAAGLVEAGHRVLKMRAGANHELDLARLAAVRSKIPEQIRVRIDANEAWDAASAISRVADLSAFGLESVEQPCRHFDLRGLAQVVARSPVPIIADESVWTLGDATNLLRNESADVLHLYLSKCGGIYQALRIAAVAEGFAKAITVGERVPLGISLAAHCHVAAVLPRLDFPCALGYDLNESDLLVAPLKRTGSAFEVPDRPGLGVEVDEQMLEHYRLRPQ